MENTRSEEHINKINAIWENISAALTELTVITDDYGTDPYRIAEINAHISALMREYERLTGEKMLSL